MFEGIRELLKTTKKTYKVVALNENGDEAKCFSRGLTYSEAYDMLDQITTNSHFYTVKDET